MGARRFGLCLASANRAPPTALSLPRCCALPTGPWNRRLFLSVDLTASRPSGADDGGDADLALSGPTVAYDSNLAMFVVTADETTTSGLYALSYVCEHPAPSSATSSGTWYVAVDKPPAVDLNALQFRYQRPSTDSDNLVLETYPLTCYDLDPQVRGSATV